MSTSMTANAPEYRDYDVQVNERDHLDVTLIRPTPIPSGGNKLVIFTHPWSRLGGQKHDPVLHRASLIFLDNGYHAVIYNCRGVGGSSGSASFTGFQEAGDLEQLIKWSCGTVGDIKTIILFGYSFGSLVTSLCPPPSSFLPSENRALRVGYVLLSHPLGVAMWLTLFNHKRYETALDDLVSSRLTSIPSAEVLFLYGTQDTFTSESRYKTCVERLEAVRTRQEQPSNESTSHATRMGSFQAAGVAGAGHFWHGESGREMRGVVKDWLRRFELGEI
ncbi:hypothetical protein M407DRAFT_209875 [Tulasnella calospora MUT 4182]|uniref:Xaa-Pro dipeptidyl-peptidase-like domain-containing protein n=1 Tax=Tulasnella calospora MUT 4182 TaxID=1051891 RepID=A0A0C3QZ19_9AGAM|nr:hypothetical protein M407DRAFT_209875 [Tulasnella calospora MUT 4182]